MYCSQFGIRLVSSRLVSFRFVSFRFVFFFIVSIYLFIYFYLVLSRIWEWEIWLFSFASALAGIERSLPFDNCRHRVLSLFSIGGLYRLVAVLKYHWKVLLRDVLA